MSEIIIQSSFRPLPGDSRLPEDSLVLHLRETLSGKVLEQVDPHHVRMSIRGQEYLVESQIPLPTNQNLLLQVEEISPKVILKLLPEGSRGEQALPSLLKRYLSADVPLELLAKNFSSLGKMAGAALPQNIQETLRELLSLLQRFSFPPQAPLPDLFAASGLFWEKKIRQWVAEGGEKSVPKLLAEDLKGLVLKLRLELQGAKEQGADLPAEKEDLLRGLDKFLQKLELCQVLNLKPSDLYERIFLLLPLWFGNQLQFVELNLSFPKRDPGTPGEEEFSALFLLHLPELGRMRIEVKVRGKDLFCLLKTADPEVGKFLNQATAPLSRQLTKLGFQPYLQVLSESMEKLNQSFFEEREEKTESLLSIRV